MGNNNSATHEKCVLNYTNGDKYVGEVLNGQREGYGTYYYQNGDKYEGIWQKNKKHGMGSMYYKDGNMYIGQWKNSEKDGTGVYYYKTGEKYEGEFQLSKKHGKGKLISQDGSVYQGEFKDNKKHGEGIMTFSNKKQFKELWESGILKSSKQLKISKLTEKTFRLSNLPFSNDQDKFELKKLDSSFQEFMEEMNEKPDTMKMSTLGLAKYFKARIPNNFFDAMYFATATSELIYENPNITDWSGNEVSRWISLIGISLDSKTEAKFKENDGVEFIKMNVNTIQKKIGITDTNKLKIILKSIDFLRIFVKLKIDYEEIFSNKDEKKKCNKEDNNSNETDSYRDNSINSIDKNGKNGKKRKISKTDYKTQSKDSQDNYFKTKSSNNKGDDDLNKSFTNKLDDSFVEDVEDNNNSNTNFNNSFNEYKNMRLNNKNNLFAISENPIRENSLTYGSLINNSSNNFSFNNNDITSNKLRNEYEKKFDENNNLDSHKSLHSYNYNSDAIINSNINETTSTMNNSPFIRKKSAFNYEANYNIANQANINTNPHNTENKTKNNNNSRKNSNSPIKTKANNVYNKETNKLNNVIIETHENNEDNSQDVEHHHNNNDISFKNKNTHEEDNDNSDIQSTDTDGNYIHNTRKYYITKVSITKLLLHSLNLSGFNFFINFEDIKLLDKIGEGGFGAVYSGMWDGKIVAIKKFHIKEKYSVKNTLNKYIKEINTIANLRHPNIVLYMGSSLTKTDCYMISEYITKGSLFDYIHVNKKTLSEIEQISIAYEIALAIRYLHSRKILHCDLKSSNILLDENMKVKIGDFGLSKLVNIFNESENKGRLGTPHWMPPEVMNKGAYLEASDVFSYGMIVWELISNEIPYYGMTPSQIIGHVADFKKIVEPPLYGNSSLRKLVKNCLLYDSDKRPSFNQIIKFLENALQKSINHDFISEDLLNFIT